MIVDDSAISWKVTLYYSCISNVNVIYFSDVVLVLKKPRLTSVGEPQSPSVGDTSAQPKLRFFAHKFVLAKSSDVFRTMLYDEAWTSPEIIETDAEDSGDNNAGMHVYFIHCYITTCLE